MNTFPLRGHKTSIAGASPEGGLVYSGFLGWAKKLWLGKTKTNLLFAYPTLIPGDAPA